MGKQGPLRNWKFGDPKPGTTGEGSPYHAANVGASSGGGGVPAEDFAALQAEVAALQTEVAALRADVDALMAAAAP